MERERERTNLIMIEKRENNLIFVATCYSELLLLTAHCSKLLNILSLATLLWGCFYLFEPIK